MNDKTLQELQRELSQTRATLELERGERLRAETIRTAVASRGAADPAAVEAVIAKRTRVNGNGDICGLDDEGRFAFGTGPGAYQTVDDLLDELSRKSPELFQGGAPAKPFTPSASITETMIRLRDDPEAKAEYLQYLSSMGRP